jgi:hypothetical protein
MAVEAQFLGDGGAGVKSLPEENRMFNLPAETRRIRHADT